MTLTTNNHNDSTNKKEHFLITEKLELVREYVLMGEREFSIKLSYPYTALTQALAKAIEDEVVNLGSACKVSVEGFNYHRLIHVALLSTDSDNTQA